MSADVPCSRIAPSPTGPLHLGNACTFLANWALARNLGWRLVLRIEDLDQDRARAAGDTGTEESLRWLGIDHDGEVVRQSERLDSFAHAMERLAAAGLIYESPHSRAEVREAAAALGAPHADDAPARFPASLRPPPGPAWSFTRRDVNHRLRIDPGTITVHDRVAGEHAFDPGAREGDCIVWTKSGFPSYQLAVTVDDIAQGVTDVVRGDDLLPSAALQSIIHRALGAAPPSWWHLPLICEAGGARMAKRHGALALSELRARGVDAGRVRGLAAHWIGAISAPRPLSSDAFRALVTEPILRAWHVGTRSAPSCLDERSLQWLHDS